MIDGFPMPPKTNDVMESHDNLVDLKALIFAWASVVLVINFDPPNFSKLSKFYSNILFHVHSP